MDPKTILDTLKKASPLDLFLVSFIALPFVFEAWIDVLDKLQAGQQAKTVSLLLVFIAYVVGIIFMLIGNNKKLVREIARDQILNYLGSHDLTMMRLKTIREKIDKRYSDDFLNSLPASFPNDIRRATLDGNDPGLARVIHKEPA